MSAGEERSTRCDRVERALRECHRRVPEGAVRQSACMHLNRALAQCILSEVCPEESEAVRSLCSSDGTVLKRSQCQQAKLYLSQCISSHRQASSPILPPSANQGFSLPCWSKSSAFVRLE